MMLGFDSGTETKATGGDADTPKTEQKQLTDNKIVTFFAKAKALLDGFVDGLLAGLRNIDTCPVAA